jgi:hypothetical protein
MVASLREQLIARIDTLSETQLAELLRYIEVLQSPELPDDYDPDNDPTIGFISGPTDLAERTEDILNAEFAQPPKGDEA